MQLVLDYLKRNQARFVAELCDYLASPASPPSPSIKRICAPVPNGWPNTAAKSDSTPRVCPTQGHPIVIARTPVGSSAFRRPRTTSPRKRGTPNVERPHFMVYGHYDVQPPEPLDLWKSPPFEPRIAGRAIFARGTTDNKGQHFAHLKAVEAYLKTGTPLPCDLTFVIEGEEEVGSANLARFLKSHRNELKCDAVVVSDTGMPDADHPALTYALRGIIAFEITVRGPSRDLHSGIFGGAVDNPAMALSQLLARLRDANGRVAVPGFYDDVAPLSAYERKQFKRLPTTDRELQKLVGVKKLFGERGFTPMEQRSARPTFEINGLTSGYQGTGSKTIVPAWARAKITCRLVPNQRPARIRKVVCDYLKKNSSAHSAAGHRGRSRRGSLSRFPHQPAGESRVARITQGVSPRAGFVARGWFHSYCERFQKNPRRGFVVARLGVAGRQRAFAE